MMVPIQVIRWYRMQCYDGTDSCAIVVPIRRYCQVVDRIVRETSLSAGDVSNTLGFGMTFLHELHHTTIGGDYHDSTELFGTGPVVDNMNIIRNELNKQGFNYGERLNYKAIHTKEGNIIPFNESALTSLKYNSSMGKKAHYIKTK